MTDFCQYCGHADIWHNMSGDVCFAPREVLYDDFTLVKRDEYCLCREFTTDWKRAEQIMKEKEV